MRIKKVMNKVFSIKKQDIRICPVLLLKLFGVNYNFVVTKIS